MLKSLLEEIKSSNWRRKMQLFSHFVIFFLGIFCSILVIFLARNYTVVEKTKYVLPSENWLQVREDFQVRKFLDSEMPADLLGQKNEALSILKVAEDFKRDGKEDKALKLFEHAIALAPKHPEILTKFGEFLEHSKRDVVKADQLYFQALIVNPTHDAALLNRQRTANIVDSLDQETLTELDRKRDALSQIHESSAALRRAKKEAYFQHIYHSVGIEGNTMSLSQTRSILETRMAVAGKSIDEHNEILGLDSALKYINASLVNRNDFISLKDILEIHKRVLGHVDPIEGGVLRTTQVYVGGHIPPGPGDLQSLMDRFEQWLNAPQTTSLHPVKLAALAHYKLVHIHPFADGNGRTSRLLMNTILMRAGYPPAIIAKQQRLQYYDALQTANEGDVRPFVRFIAECAGRTLDLYLWATGGLTPQIPLMAEQEDGGMVLKIDPIDEGSGQSAVKDAG
ncbi:protein adenylyltransferase Fic [Phlebotomus argentipes]|uniref:protein adenylyltransferase Fic n=1 Tax=Phlebotomus argentipes TaxID=94469 RepID=UPI00289376F5|nr:protein adenylyltransferase Fic [Phlebotomus argentipes]